MLGPSRRSGDESALSHKQLSSLFNLSHTLPILCFYFLSCCNFLPPSPSLSSWNGGCTDIFLSTHIFAGLKLHSEYKTCQNVMFLLLSLKCSPPRHEWTYWTLWINSSNTLAGSYTQHEAQCNDWLITPRELSNNTFVHLWGTILPVNLLIFFYGKSGMFFFLTVDFIMH